MDVFPNFTNQSEERHDITIL